MNGSPHRSPCQPTRPTSRPSTCSRQLEPHLKTVGPQALLIKITAPYPLGGCSAIAGLLKRIMRPRSVNTHSAWMGRDLLERGSM